MNRGMKVLQTLALPLGYGAMLIFIAAYIGFMPSFEIFIPPHCCEGTTSFMERKTGFEPATSTLARSHSTTESLPHDKRAFGDPEGTRTLDL